MYAYVCGRQVDVDWQDNGRTVGLFVQAKGDLWLVAVGRIRHDGDFVGV